MCGIAGFQGEYSVDLLRAMTDCIAHRGPDGEGLVGFAPARGRAAVGLAHRRLAIIDLSAEGSQPMTVRCECCGAHSLEELALVFNGEIYNFRELRAELVQRGHTFHSQTDSEVLLHLYAEHGVGMLSRLNGIFALAIRDGRSRGQTDGVRQGDLFIARDGLGVKPLYYTADARGLLFASEIKSLLQDGGVSRELDHVALHQTLAYLWTPAPRTMLRAVAKLPPGDALLVRSGSIARQWTFYELPYGREPWGHSEAEIAAELREHVEAAVARQMVADVPVGAFLSGGLDSSAVVAMMRRANPGTRPRCYSIGFVGDEDNDGSPADLPYAHRVAEHLDVDLHTITVRPDIIGNLERMLYFLDEPQADPAPINALLIAEQARRDGIKVLLSGAGGDDLLTGYRRHRALQLEKYWGWLPAGVRSGLAATAQRAGTGVEKPWKRRLQKAFSHAHLSPEERLVAYFWWSGEQLRRSLYTPALADELRGEETAAPLLRSLEAIPGERDPINRMLFLEAKHFLADHNLNYTDKTGMAAGVEVRVPLLDLELVDFATRIPTRFKQRGGVGKSIFKKAMEPLLPHDVIYRPKTGFGAPLRRWLHQELRGMVDDVLSPDSLRRRGLFDPAAVQRLIGLDRAGTVDAAYTIFSLVCTELWLRMFVDGPVPRVDSRPLLPQETGS